MSRLPPLNAVRVFEAAARHESCSRAADELSVTHGAVSRQIKLLESFFEIDLFRRTGRGLKLTAAGESYFAAIAPIFATLEGASDIVRKRRALRINTLPTFATNWLFPRISIFREHSPAIDIEITTGLKTVSSLPRDFDLYIRREENDVQGLWKSRLIDEFHFPVCAPSYLAKYAAADIPDLEIATILHCAARPSAWGEWLGQHSPRTALHGPSQTFESLYICLQAAADGVGIAMGASSLTEQYLASGALVAPFGCCLTRCASYYLIVRSERLGDPALDRLCTWISNEGAIHDAAFADQIGSAPDDRGP